MRTFVLIALASICAAVAADQPYEIRHECDGADVVLMVHLARPGTLTFRIPHDLCGQDS